VTALQPVWDGYCADPFVLRTANGYTMYGSAPGPRADGRLFQILTSNDLIRWTDVGGALVPLTGAESGTDYWAPEVVEVDGVYWMYYSAGIGDAGHHLRVATATEAAGPFHDTGVDLTPDLPFAIDPSPFLDAAGSRWLFFATDKPEGERPGTVIAIARMISMSSLGEHRILLTASADWQRYQADRPMYGQLRDWHTLEGPQVICHDGRYWMCFSAGNWHGAGYGVGLATARQPQGPWRQVGDGPGLLNSADTGLIGPGHNSLFTNHAGELWTAFHAWDQDRTRRSPYLVKIDWTADDPQVRHPLTH
jgi:arabinan endo-1,5-alpha-L-arabinosidase